MIKTFLSCVALLSCLFFSNNVHAQQATNPIIFADVPDMSMVRVGDTCYMSSTTHHAYEPRSADYEIKGSCKLAIG